MRTPKERDLCWCVGVNGRPYKECQREYNQNATVEDATNFADVRECEKMRSPVERDLCLCLNIDKRPYMECHRDYEK